MSIPYLKVMGRSRAQIYTLPRQVLMWEIKTYYNPDISYPALGRLFNHDHKTAFYAVHKIAKMMAKGEI
ncbi:helix-turn-helix domain-containing protein [Rhizobium mesoamericanum]|uniref:Chromosomal replication initiator DnaA C-terminal domain-containing protein n=1 Tax=Rhizobium mesoamericanum STM3625 TaxID=1211777 RepID=K0PVF1_9HYPH|nr:helix-turn-helix domain-containing protein [Rhizobium mesoamericanum]CCM75122.1 hypothetical protein BN77_2285 [Rhizobium mesoamericanum STM3625]